MVEEDAAREDSMISEQIKGFTHLETGTLAIYRSHYERIFWDLDRAEAELSGEKTDYGNLIHAAAHLRLVIEAVAMASFTASRTLFVKAGLGMQGAKDFSAMRKSVKSLNPHYWPTSFGPVAVVGGIRTGVRREVGLQETEVGRYFGTVSELLHVHNPFAKKKPEPAEYPNRLEALITGFHDPLDSHIVQLAQSPEYLYLRRLDDGEIVVQAVATEHPLL